MSTAYRTAILDAHVEPTPPAGVLPVLVLVKRQGGTRHILNYDALKRALMALPVELHEYLEGTSVSETFLLYSKADVIVAPHGAAQVNNMLSLPGTHLVEFDTFFTSNMMYLNSSCALGHNFSFFVPRNSTKNDVGFHVDVSRAAAHVSSIVRSRS
jgi:capsular polysaccharide biosynthesis protein